MWIKIPEWLFVLVVSMFFISAVLSDILKHLDAKYAKNQAERELDKEILDKEIAKLELEKIRITTSSSGSSTPA